MPRITCKIASPGRTLNGVLINVPTTFTNVLEAPDFSLPDPNDLYPDRDVLDTTRAIRPGQIEFITPLMVTNKTAAARWIDVRLQTEIEQSVMVPGRVLVPANDTVLVPMQGRSLMKRVAMGVVGDRLQVRAEAVSVFDVWITAEERLSSEHVGVV